MTPEVIRALAQLERRIKALEDIENKKLRLVITKDYFKAGSPYDLQQQAKDKK